MKSYPGPLLAPGSCSESGSCIPLGDSGKKWNKSPAQGEGRAGSPPKHTAPAQRPWAQQTTSLTVHFSIGERGPRPTIYAYSYFRSTECPLFVTLGTKGVQVQCMAWFLSPGLSTPGGRTVKEGGHKVGELAG